MKVAEYFNNVGIDDLLSELFELYPDQVDHRDGYIAMYNNIHTLIPKDGTMCVRLSRILQTYEESDLETDDYISVCGVDPEAKEDEYGRSGEDITWAIEYHSWEEWLGMEVRIETLDDRCNTNVRILAHIIWEMSWSGFTQEEVEEQKQEIEDRYTELNDILAVYTHQEAVEKGLLFEFTGLTNLDESNLKS